MDCSFSVHGIFQARVLEWGAITFSLTCMQISQEAGKVVWYSHFFKNFPQFVVVHTVKDFGVVNKADVFWNSVAFFL